MHEHAGTLRSANLWSPITSSFIYRTGAKEYTILMIKGREAALLAALTVAFACGGRPDRLPDPMSRVASEIAAASRRIVENVNANSGSHLGFDTSKYPGDDAMRAWREGDSPYEWVGYYLPSACHKDDSWGGKRTALQDMGWGLAVVYVGQQTWGRAPGKPVVISRVVKRRVRERTRLHAHTGVRYVTRRVRLRTVVAPRVLPGQSCSPQLVSASRGSIDARDAIRRAAAEGFPAGTVVFLDVEHMDIVPPEMRAYYGQWAAVLLEDARYRPGVYAHSANARLIHDDIKGVYLSHGNSSEPPFWVAGASGFTPGKSPTAVGHAFAAVWQGILDVVETRNGVRLKIDRSVASAASPSADAGPIRTASIN